MSLPADPGGSRRSGHRRLQTAVLAGCVILAVLGFGGMVAVFWVGHRHFQALGRNQDALQRAGRNFVEEVNGAQPERAYALTSEFYRGRYPRAQFMGEARRLRSQVGPLLRIEEGKASFEGGRRVATGWAIFGLHGTHGSAAVDLVLIRQSGEWRVNDFQYRILPQ